MLSSEREPEGTAKYLLVPSRKDEGRGDRGESSRVVSAEKCTGYDFAPCLVHLSARPSAHSGINLCLAYTYQLETVGGRSRLTQTLQQREKVGCRVQSITPPSPALPRAPFRTPSRCESRTRRDKPMPHLYLPVGDRGRTQMCGTVRKKNDTKMILDDKQPGLGPGRADCNGPCPVSPLARPRPPPQPWGPLGGGGAPWRYLCLWPVWGAGILAM